mmetsp:Transcript_37108/g.96238  ORF Transcript_37108/g.96238 Transcript_37108/m.96238 type:complete len:140 (-) Transcript_37108:1811-2230(-)
MGGRWEVGVWEWGEKLSKGRQGGMKEEEMKDEKRVGAYERLKLNIKTSSQMLFKSNQATRREGDQTVRRGRSLILLSSFVILKRMHVPTCQRSSHFLSRPYRVRPTFIFFASHCTCFSFAVTLLSKSKNESKKGKVKTP